MSGRELEGQGTKDSLPSFLTPRDLALEVFPQDRRLLRFFRGGGEGRRLSRGVLLLLLLSRKPSYDSPNSVRATFVSKMMALQAENNVHGNIPLMACPLPHLI